MSEYDFSNSYEEARQRFRQSAAATGATVSSYPVQVASSTDDDFTIDVASIGPEGSPVLVTSSGVHGVEGFLGSAIQSAFLEQLANENIIGNRHILIHAINPYGFSRRRRFNENNVDINRNFLSDPRQYRGAPESYTKLNRLLNPSSPPSKLDPFLIRAAWAICRFGMNEIQQSIAAGQYEHAQGIFFGGFKPSQSTLIIQRNIDAWIGSTQNALHIDFHSGLGDFGKYKLLIAELAGSDAARWYCDVFSVDHVAATGATRGPGYRALGPIGEWLQDHFAPREYRFVTAEFGTYSPLRIIRALRTENRVHHYEDLDSRVSIRAKHELLECFCPRSLDWRRSVVRSGMHIIRQGMRAIRASKL